MYFFTIENFLRKVSCDESTSPFLHWSGLFLFVLIVNNFCLSKINYLFLDKTLANVSNIRYTMYIES